MGSSKLRKRLLIGGIAAAVLIVAASVYVAVSTWGAVNRVSIDRETADSPGGVAAQADDEGEEDESDNSETSDQGLQVFLLLGSDSREDLEGQGYGEFDGNRADVVMVLLKNGPETALLSLPRDLYVDNPCTGGQERLSEALQGCDSMNGPSLLTVTVEEIIGQPVDHFAMVDLSGFQEAVDVVGGYEICVERDVRDELALLELEAGCTHASGEQTLAWLRSRHTQELTEDGWRIMPGVNDLVRNERQRAFLIDMMSRLGDISSPQRMAAIAQSVAPFVTVDSELTLVDAVNLAMTLRGLGSDEIVELDVPVYDFTTERGASVLLPSTPVEEIVADFLSATARASGSPMFGIDS